MKNLATISMIGIFALANTASARSSNKWKRDGKKDGITVFVTTHYMDEAEYCDRVSIMVDGRIEALDTPQGLKKTYNAGNMDGVFLKLARGCNI